MPPVGMTVSDLHKAWKQMEVAENERDKAIRNERLRCNVVIIIIIYPVFQV